MRSNRILAFFLGRFISQPLQLQRWILNQGLRDQAARDTIGLPPLPQLGDESVSEFSLPRLRLG